MKLLATVMLIMPPLNVAEHPSQSSRASALLDVTGSGLTVPEPSTIALAALGVVGIFATRRRRKK